MLDRNPVLPAPQETAELRRILALPRRVYTREQVEAIVREMSLALRLVDDAWLFPPQAVGLVEMAMRGGGIVGALDTGRGKTLLSLLAFTVLGGTRPVLVTKSSLVRKTQRAMLKESQRWRIRTDIRIVGFGELSVKGGVGILEHADPLVIDEAHNVCNVLDAGKPSARAMRVERAILGGSRRNVLMSASFVDGSIASAATACAWALGGGSPLPLRGGEIAQWAAALDAPRRRRPVAAPGVLQHVATAEGDADAHAWFARRFAQTLGVIVDRGEDGVHASITIDRMDVELSTATKQHLARLQDRGEAPDGSIVLTDSDAARLRWQLARGFWTRLVQPPPEEWAERRDAWAAVCAQEIAAGVADSPDHLAARADAGEVGHYVADVLAEWRAVRGTFTEQHEAIRTCPRFAEACAAWLRKHPKGIAWVHHKELGRWISELSGYPYLDSDGDDVEERRGPLVLSMNAHAEGNNLQHGWNANLLCEPPARDRRWHQLIARTHRTGQPDPEVIVDVASPLDGGHDGSSAIGRLARAHQEAQRIQANGGGRRKVLLADIAFPLTPPEGVELDPWWVD